MHVLVDCQHRPVFGQAGQLVQQRLERALLLPLRAQAQGRVTALGGNRQEIGDKWNAAIELAAGAGDDAVKGKLQVDYQRHMERTLALSANKNTVHLQVTANGGLFEKSEIHVKVYATLVRLQ